MLPEPALGLYTDTMRVEEAYNCDDLQYRDDSGTWHTLPEGCHQALGYLLPEVRLVVRQTPEEDIETEQIPWQHVYGRMVYLRNGNCVWIKGIRQGLDGDPIFTDAAGIDRTFRTLKHGPDGVHVDPRKKGSMWS